MSTDEGMKFAFVSAATEESPYWDALTEEVAEATWDEWIDRVRAEAWDECEMSLYRWFNDPFAGDAPRNPYRETGDSDEHR